MAACGSLEHIFEKPLPEPPTFLESFSPWKHIRSMKSIDNSSSSSSSSFTEIFGELHFKDSSHLQSSPQSASSSSSDGLISTVDHEKKPNYYQKKEYKHSDSFNSMNSESLSLCTEGLGFESFDDVDDLMKHDVCDKESEDQIGEKDVSRNYLQMENHRNNECSKVSSSRRSGGAFPPPISCIGRSGKPWVCFKSYREDGRFILKEIRIPTQEFMHACRENGRLKLQFIQSDDEILEEDEEDEDEDENEQDSQQQNDDDDDEQCR